MCSSKNILISSSAFSVSGVPPIGKKTKPWGAPVIEHHQSNAPSNKALPCFHIPGYSFNTASAPLIFHFVAISTLSSSSGSSVPQVKIAGGAFILYISAKKGEISGSRLSASVVEGRYAAM
jgi:hypothetical protein